MKSPSGIALQIVLLALLSFSPGFSMVAATAGPGAVDTSPTLYFEVASTAELLGAVDSMPADGGATIRLRPGVYTLAAPIRFRKAFHVNVFGSGWNTEIKQTGEGDAIVFESCGFCRVQDLMLSGPVKAEAGSEAKESGATPGAGVGAGAAKRGSGIVMKDSSSCVVALCRISSFPESGIRFEGDPKIPSSSNTVRNCHFIGNAGVQLDSVNNNDFYFIGNQFGTHGLTPRTGCRLDRSSAGTYSMNYHWGNEVALKMEPFCLYNRIENNRFEQSRREGIIIGNESPDGPNLFHILTGNTIHTNGEFTHGVYSAVVARDAVNITFTSNQVFSWDGEKTTHKHALDLGRGCASWIVKDNFLMNCEKEAIHADPKAGHVIKDNVE